MQCVHHVGYTVPDIERSVAFYENVLGFACLTRQTVVGGYLAEITGYPDVAMEQAFVALPGGVILELLQYTRPQGAPRSLETFYPGVAHVCLQVEDLQTLYERLKDAGVAFRSPLVTIPSGRNKGGRAVYFRDPDGITWELFQRPADAQPTFRTFSEPVKGPETPCDTI